MCFHANSDSHSWSSGVLPNVYSPTISNWIYVDNDVKDMSLYGDNTLWKLDKSGMIWEGVDIIDRNMVNFQWERRGYQSKTFTEVVAIDNIAFALNGGNAYVYTGK